MTTSSLEADDRLSLLYKLSRTFSSSLDLDEVLNLVMDEVIDVMKAERGFVMLREDDGRLTFRAARGIDRETIDDPQFQVSRSVVERVAYEGQPMLTGDAQMDDWLSLRKSVISLGLRSILCVPLTVKERVSGVIYVDNRLQAGYVWPQGPGAVGRHRRQRGHRHRKRTAVQGGRGKGTAGA